MSASPPDQLSIYNKALILLGSARRLSSADNGDSDDAANFNALWPIARRSTLVLHPWNFAISRTSIERDPQMTGHGGPRYRYLIPPTCLRWLPWPRGHAFYFDGEEEGGYLLSDNAGPIVLRHIFDQTELHRWAPLCLDVAAYTLAIEYCQGKSQLLGLRDRLASERADLLEDALRVDGHATAQRNAGPMVAQSRWAGARFRSVSERGL